MTHDEALAFIGRNTRAVLATIKRDGRPQMSHVSYTLDDDGVVKVSVTGDRAKTRNLKRDPRATLSIVAENWRVCEAILQVARERQISIPADLSIVGYGQNLLSLVAPVGITVSMISVADWSSSVWSYALRGMRMR